MRHTLDVRMKREEAALVRLLGQISRRGYDILAVRAHLTPDQGEFQVEVEFEPIQPIGGAKPHPAEHLPALVSKLWGVAGAELRRDAMERVESPR
jgi:acetolactate synthase regulatory subunit